MRMSAEQLHARGYNPDGTRRTPTPPVEQKENTETSVPKDERELHETFLAWCRINNLPVIHSRMDRKPTIRESWPDMTVLWKGQACCIEFKIPGNSLTPGQRAVIEELLAALVPVKVCYSVLEAIQFTKEKLKL